MKIGMLASSFPRFEGDYSGNFLYHLGRKLSKKGVEVVIIAPFAPGYTRFDIWSGIKIYRFPYFWPARYHRLCYGSGVLSNIKKSKLATCQVPFFIGSELFWAKRVIEKEKIDILHAHWLIPQGLTGVFLKKIKGIPLVLTIHGSDVYALTSKFWSAIKARVIKQADVCSVNSSSTLGVAQQLFPEGRYEVIPMGVNIEQFSIKDRNSGREEREMSNILLYIGRLINWKGVNFLIQALPLVLEKYPATKLVLVGNGPEKDRLVKLSSDLGVAGAVIFEDYISQEELPDRFHRADIFILPSIIDDQGCTEGLGVVLLEAMAAGVPVIGNRVGGIPDIIKDGETGLLARPKDPRDLAEKIIYLLREEILRERLVENGLDYVKKNFSWDKLAERFRTIYQKLGTYP
jgi:L-malate glycosyltransferase